MCSTTHLTSPQFQPLPISLPSQSFYWDSSPLHPRSRLDSANAHKSTILVSLYLSATFDTIDHSILLNCHHSTFGISRAALQCITSYLTNRSPYVKLGNSSFNHKLSASGVLQGCPWPSSFHHLSSVSMQNLVSHFLAKFTFWRKSIEWLLMNIVTKFEIFVDRKYIFFAFFITSYLECC